METLLKKAFSISSEHKLKWLRPNIPTTHIYPLLVLKKKKCIFTFTVTCTSMVIKTNSDHIYFIHVVHFLSK